jgi:hypothetical protein
MQGLDAIVVFLTRLMAFAVIACELVGSLVLRALNLGSLDGGIRRTLVGAGVLAICILILAELVG